nr:reverse transcriptase domain-containing protein [Tanacetum cinerariifolium]
MPLALRLHPNTKMEVYSKHIDWGQVKITKDIMEEYVMPKYGKMNWMEDDSWTDIILDDVYNTFYRDEEEETEVEKESEDMELSVMKSDKGKGKEAEHDHLKVNKGNKWHWNEKDAEKRVFILKSALFKNYDGMDFEGHSLILCGKVVADMQQMLLEEADLEHGLEHAVSSSCRANPEEGTGGRASRGGGRTRGRSGDQGDGRIDGQDGQVGGQGSEQLQNLLPTIVAQVGDQGRGQGNGRNQNGDTVNNNIRGDVSRGCTNKEFLACNPNEYDGKGGAIVYNCWIEKIKSAQDISGCRDSQKVKYTASSFVGKALTWWNSQIHARGREADVATEPKTIQKAVQIAGTLTDEALRNGSIKKNPKKRENGGEPMLGNYNIWGCTYKDFLACNPKEYDGKGGAIVYTRWIEKIESVHDMSGCKDSQRVKYIASSFVGKALAWWNFKIRTRGREAAVGMSWEHFRTLTREEFCLSNEMYFEPKCRYIFQFERGRTQSLVAEKTDISETRASTNFHLMYKMMTSDHNSSELGLHGHRNEQSSSKLVSGVTSVANNTSGLVSQRQKALDYDNPDAVPQRQDVYSSADADVPSQQELNLLFGPLYDEFFNAGSNPQDKQTSTNVQSTSALSTHTNVHAEENNDQAEEGEQLQDNEFTNPFLDTDEEVDEQELEAHYSYMAKIQEVLNADSGIDSEPVEQVQNDTRCNVFANALQHSEQSESVSNTCLVETDDSNVTPDSPDMCEDDIQNDQNDAKSDDERIALANLIANLKLDTEFEKYKAFNDCTIDYDKLERKLNEALGQLAQKDTVIREGLKTKAYELSVVKEKHNELMKQSLLTKLHYEGLVKQKTKVITNLKLREEHDIEEMLSMEKQLNFLNEVVYKRSQSIQTIHMMAPKVSTYNGRPTFANPRYLKQAQSEVPCLYAFPYDQYTHANRFILDREETLALERESRFKLNKDLVRPYDYTKLNSLYDIFKPPTQEYETQLAHANEIRRKMW